MYNHNRAGDAYTLIMEKEMITLPHIEKSRLIAYCGLPTYQSGQEFLSQHPFYVYYREWSVLKGICEGSTSPSYCVRILFNNKGIANSCCTCYTNRTAPCKHIAALLVLWYEHHTHIPDRSEWSRQLRMASKEDLILLLEKMVDLYPDSFLGCDPCMIES